jgi:non-canonical poly(A) RNA polymerase PAPD5/7
MALALSDIDLRIVKREALDEQASDKPPTHEERRDNLRDLYTLRYKTFDGGSKNKSAAKYKDANLRYARYPLISVQDRGSGIDVQIVAANNTAQQRGLIQRYMKEYPFLRQTYAVIKTLFDQRGLSDVFRGGFGSYTLFMMLVASLQNQANQRRDAAGALVNFLYYWAYFKTKEHGVSIAPPEYFDKQENPVLTNTLKAKIAVS